MKRFGAGSIVTAFAVLVVATQAWAISLATSFRAPLTTPYVECGAEQSTTDCTTGSMELNSPWTFSAGTIEIDDTEISLRIDDLRLADGLDCDADVASGACNCWDNNSGTCTDDSDCDTPDRCGPRGSAVGTDNNYFVVKLFMQDKFTYTGMGTYIRRNVNCYREIDFDLKDINGSNQNRQVNQTISTSIEGCGVGSDAHGVEIRHVVVEDKYGNIVAKVSH